MKPIISRRTKTVIFHFCLIILINLHCSRKVEQTAIKESKITLLFRGSEQDVFRDGKSTHLLMFLPLVEKDEVGKPQPRLLERWEYSDDYSEWIFHLRKDVRWHDGKPAFWPVL